ncbi:hypothetical protein COT30_04235 [Candidatus Micrarchaeota archaeon CG08_land_8_20_14_0_20_49_17]|nr:MAG: hypothetical protein AUJ13_03825 [Candidatus Micrarchaeota archaeon CG1_02_49_24]PIU09464.1 MAG: hypothetical protein COT30_04235 [Candidatus Micrarchaeota archaeon CG08_land_8_20_14_0_20_49_17]PIZ99407.1 MAG: hypothetical protein COX84_01020 [Candidatus Micrarchaeota archaeon CG_4_10_14_0_2_um_filter_49_7]HII53641.1 hypothetical protein [Candidatus Micrarchaeota archaeon]
MKITCDPGKNQEKILETRGGKNIVEVSLGEGAKLFLLNLDRGRLITKLNIHFAKDSQAKIFFVQTGLASDYAINALLDAEGASAEVNGVFVGGGNGTANTAIAVTHAVSHTSSSVSMHRLLKGSSSSNFHGTIKITKAAQSSDSFLEDRALMVGKQAKAFSVPSLVIDANDVKAGHSASIGSIDPAQLFYLQTRGMDAAGAARLIAEGFFQPLFAKIEKEEHRNQLRRVIERMW